MFTGIVEELGRIESIEERPPGRRFWIAADRVLEGARIGDSIAVNGCCLTAVAVEPGRFAVEAVPETLARTTLGTAHAGDAVDLEGAMRLGERLGGHLVQGHVDGVGEVVAVAAEGDGRRVTVAVPPALARYVAEKGSIAIDGISLTVARVDGARCEVALIPHTLAVTVAGAWRAGSRVHLEVDLLARYLGRLLDERRADGRDA